MGQRDRRAEIEQGFRLLHMGKKDALEASEVSAARRVPTALWSAEPAEMAVTDASLRQVGRELGLRKALLARDWRRADVENKSTFACLRVRMKASIVPPS